MANTKTWAFTKDENGNYILDENGKERYIKAERALKVRKYEPDSYDKISFWSTHKNEKSRVQLVLVERSNTIFFRCLNAPVGNNGGSGDAETRTHVYIKEYLSSQEKLTFQFGKEMHCFNIIDCKVEAKFQFGEDEYYYPDLYIHFEEPSNPYEKKWGGKVAIEIKVSNKVHDKKRRDFEIHNIPIIEIEVPEFLHFGFSLDNEENQNKFFQRLEKYYGNFIKAKVISEHAEMPLYRYERYIKSKNKIEELENRIKELEVVNKRIQQNITDYKVFIDNKYNPLLRQNSILQEKIAQLENRTFSQKIIDLLK